MKVTVEKIGGTDVVLVPDNATVGEIVRLSTGSDASGYSVTVDDQPAQLGDTVRDGALVSIVPTKTKGA